MKLGNKIKKEILISPIIIIIIWYCIGYFELISPLFIPKLEDVFKKFFHLFSTGDINHDLLKTLYRMLLGYVFAAIIGIPIGLIIGFSKKLYLSVEVVLEFLRSIPSPVLVPLSMLFFGLGDTAKIAIVVFTCSLINIINTMYGVQNVSKIRIMVANTLHAKYTDLFKYVIFWDALPHIFVGLRLTINLSLIVVVVTEMFTGTIKGLGLRIYDAHDTGRIAEMYAEILIIGILGFIANKLFVKLEKKIVHWGGI